MQAERLFLCNFHRPKVDLYIESCREVEKTNVLIVCKLMRVVDVSTAISIPG